MMNDMRVATVHLVSCVLLFLIVAPPAVRAADTAPPDPVQDLRAAASTDSTITLAWTAPGNDGMSGTVSSYDLRASTKEIIAGEEAGAPIIGGEPDPVPGGETQTMVIESLKPDTAYWFVIKSQDRAGNVSAFSNIISGSTKLDTTGPHMNAIQTVDLAQASGRVVWATDEPSTSEVKYGETADYGQQAYASALVTAHALPLGGLKPNTRYHYALRSMDYWGNVTASGDMTFVTAGDERTQSTAAQTAVSAHSAVSGTIAFTPTTLNLASRAAWMTAVLRLPKEARKGMDFDSLLINGAVKPSQRFTSYTQTVLSRYGTLWLRFSRADLAGIAPPEVKEATFTLTGETDAGPFEASQTLTIANNITQAEWERTQDARQKAFEKDKEKRVNTLQKQIEALKKQLEQLLKKLEIVQGAQFQ